MTSLFGFVSLASEELRNQGRIRHMLCSTTMRWMMGVGFAAIATTSVHAQSVAEFYKGKTVTILVGSDVGGGYDIYARLVGRHLGKHIPGNPIFVAQNMPSVASVAATNHIANIAPKDGTVIGAIQREIAMVQIVGSHQTRFKASELIWLGSLLSEPGVCGFSSRAGINSFDEVFKREVIMGSSGPNALEQYPSMFNNMLGAKFKIVKGYKATTDVALAIDRGEVNGICQSWSTFKQLHANALKAGTMKPMVQVALKADPEMTKLGLKNFMDYATPEHIQPGYTRESVQGYLDFQLSTTLMGRPYAISGEVPKDRAEALVKGFETMVSDPEFLEDAKRTKRDIDFVSGKDISEMIARLEKMPKSMVEKMDDVLKN
jgi:tripartite-type tricarboxylate transporter receptor subunit TctC